MYWLFWNVTPHDEFTSSPFVSKEVDTSPAMSISQGVLLSIDFTVFILVSKLKIESSQFLGFNVDKNNMAKLVGAVVVNDFAAVVVALVVTDVVLLVGVVVVVVGVVVIGWWLSVAIVTMPAMHVAQNITNHIMIL